MQMNLRLLHLPVDGADATRERRPSPASRVTARRRSLPERPHESARILIVDDEPAVAEPVRDYLLGRGFAVDIAFSVDDALIAIRQVSRDVVLLDSSMSQRNGVEALKRIHAADAALPVIVMTGNADASLEQEMLKLGACKSVVKPIDFADLDRATTAALTSRRAKAPGHSDVAMSLRHVFRREPRVKRLDSRSVGLA